MKKVILLFFTLIITVLLTSCKSGGFSSGIIYDNADKYLIGSQEYDATIDELEIDWLAGKVTLIEDSTLTKISVIEESDLEDYKKVHTWLDGKTLHVKYAESGLVYTWTMLEKNQKNVTIKYNPVTTLDIDLTSAKLEAESINAKEVNFDYTSGDLNIGSLNAENVNIDYTSGSFTINSLTANKLSVDSTSGDFKALELKADDVDVNLTSGDFTANLKEVSKLEMDTTSGNIKLTIPDSIRADITATSGNVELTIPENIRVDLTLKKTSGNLKTEKTFTKIADLYQFGPMEVSFVACYINVVITSGTLRIK